jgi:phospholipid transport system substrate-binding protein
MGSMKKVLEGILVISSVLVAAPVVLADGGSPKAVMSQTVDQLVAAVEKFPEEAQADARRTELRKIIEPKFDFDEMAKRSLGSHWRSLDAAQQKEFVDAFSELLARTYLSRIENVKKNMVTVDSEDVRNKTSGVSTAKVKTTVDYKGDSFPIDYKLFKRADTNWKVYDVIIENIGLVVNYRNEFAGIIRKEKFSGLMKKLKEKVKGKG